MSRLQYSDARSKTRLMSVLSTKPICSLTCLVDRTCFENYVRCESTVAVAVGMLRLKPRLRELRSGLDARSNGRYVSLPDTYLCR